MNVKIGDLAVIIGGSKLAGRIVEVYAHCPQNVEFRLPNGQLHCPCSYEWICRLQNPVMARVASGDTLSFRQTIWAPVPDRLLRPISGLPVDAEQHDEVTA